jgi:hypothetical protein
MFFVKSFLLWVLLTWTLSNKVFALEIEIPVNLNLSEMAIALSELTQGLRTTTKAITLLNANNRKQTAFSEFIMEIHRLQLQTCIFNDIEKFFKVIDANLKRSLEVTAIIFHNPDDFIQEVIYFHHSNESIENQTFNFNLPNSK